MADIKNTILWVEDKRPSIRGYVDKIKQEFPAIHHDFSSSLEIAISKIDKAVESNEFYKMVFIDLHFESFPTELETFAKQENLSPDFNEGQFFALWLEQKLPNQKFHFITGLGGAFNKSIVYKENTHEMFDKNIVLPSELQKKLIDL